MLSRKWYINLTPSQIQGASQKGGGGVKAGRGVDHWPLENPVDAFSLFPLKTVRDIIGTELFFFL